MRILGNIRIFPVFLCLLAGLTHVASPMALAAVTMPQQNLARCTPAQWSGVFTIAANLPFAQRIAFWAELAAVESVYAADPLGEGKQRQPDTDPLIDFARVDCVTYAEQVYALALATNADAVPAMLQKIRYRDGQIDFRWRNHFLVSDWLPANGWFIRDITAEVGAGFLQPMTKTISRGAFFSGKGLRQYADLPEETATTAYIPRDRVSGITEKLRTGDLAIFVIDTPGIIAGHTGLLVMRDGTAYLQHASVTAKSVVTVRLQDYLRSAPARFLGCTFARPFVPVPPQPEAVN